MVLNLKRLGFILLGVALLFLASSAYSASNIQDQSLKAAISFKLSKFVKWPHSRDPSFIICVYGQQQNLITAWKKLEKRQVARKPIRIQFHQRISPKLNSCNLLYISESNVTQVRALIMSVSHSPVLTISDIKNFTSFGGMIELSNRNQRTHFVINLNAVKRVGVNISSTLLELATIVAR